MLMRLATGASLRQRLREAQTPEAGRRRPADAPSGHQRRQAGQVLRWFAAARTLVYQPDPSTHFSGQAHIKREKNGDPSTAMPWRCLS
jgi:hypothetical protein